MIIKTIDALKFLVATQSTAVMIADLKDKTHPWKQDEYDMGYALCEEAKLWIQLGIGDAAAISTFVMQLMSIM